MRMGVGREEKTQKVEFSSRCLPKCTTRASVSPSGDTVSYTIMKTLQVEFFSRCLLKLQRQHFLNKRQYLSNSILVSPHHLKLSTQQERQYLPNERQYLSNIGDRIPTSAEIVSIIGDSISRMGDTSSTFWETPRGEFHLLSANVGILRDAVSYWRDIVSTILGDTLRRI